MGSEEDAREALDLLGGLNKIVKKGDSVLIKPNQNYPALPGMPQWTSTTDGMVLVGLTELLFEAGARKVVVGESHVWGPTSVFVRDGVQEAIEKAGGETVDFEKEPFVRMEVPGGLILKEQAIPKSVVESDVVINVPKAKPTTVGHMFVLGFKNSFGFVPFVERLPWHRTPEFLYLLTDLMKLVKPALTIIDALVITERDGASWGTPYNLGLIIAGQDPVATEAVTMSVLGHEPREQPVLAIADKYGLGTSHLSQIEVRGKSIQSVRRYTIGGLTGVAHCVHPSPNVNEYVGGACFGCETWVDRTPFPWEMEKNKKYALIVGNLPRTPEKFTQDEVWVLGSCAAKSKTKILAACPEGVTPKFIGGCPPYWHRRPGYKRAYRERIFSMTHNPKDLEVVEKRDLPGPLAPTVYIKKEKVAAKKTIGRQFIEGK